MKANTHRYTWTHGSTSRARTSSCMPRASSPDSCLLHHSPIHLPYWSPNLAAFGDAYRWLTSAVTSTSDRTATSDPINGSFIACAPYPAACVLPALSLRSPCTALCTTLRTILVHDLPHNEMGGHETAQPPATACAQVTTCRRTRSLLPPQATVLRRAHSDQAGPRHTGAHGGDRTLPLLGPALTQLPPPSRNPG